ncbi:UNVERIFIED_CONTAM: hypothetical protein GTU68_051805 [Idotea baltica]|nr:hypothetical protein [Idotea baltica]
MGGRGVHSVLMAVPVWSQGRPPDPPEGAGHHVRGECDDGASASPPGRDRGVDSANQRLRDGLHHALPPPNGRQAAGRAAERREGLGALRGGRESLADARPRIPSEAREPGLAGRLPEGEGGAAGGQAKLELLQAVDRV